MWCTSCGHKLIDGARFCDKCGAMQTPPPVVQSTEPTPKLVMHQTVPSSPKQVEPTVSEGVATRPLQLAKLELPDHSEIDLPLEGSFLIGRKDGSTPIDLDLTEIDTELYSSRKHAEITVRFGEYYIKDLGSRNGTYVNDQKIGVNEEVKLHDQDRIILGRVQLIFKLGM